MANCLLPQVCHVITSFHPFHCSSLPSFIDLFRPRSSFKTYILNLCHGLDAHDIILSLQLTISFSFHPLPSLTSGQQFLVGISLLSMTDSNDDEWGQLANRTRSFISDLFSVLFFLKYYCDFLHCCCFILGLSLLPVRRLPRGKNREGQERWMRPRIKWTTEKVWLREETETKERKITLWKKNNPETSPNEYPQQSIVNGNSGGEGRGESGEDRVRRSRKREGTLERTETSNMKDGR